MIDYQELDPGIRDTVKRVQAHGFTTTESGDGVSKPPAARTFHVPHVICRLDHADAIVPEAHRLQTLLGESWRVEATYAPNEPAFLIATLPAAPAAGGTGTA